MDPPKRSLSLTKSEACLRHIEAAIAAFERGLFDVAITLAGAAEGMSPDTGAPHLFTVLRDHPRVTEIEHLLDEIGGRPEGRSSRCGSGRPPEKVGL